MPLMTAARFDERFKSTPLVHFMRKGCYQTVSKKDENNKKKLLRRAEALHIQEHEVGAWIANRTIIGRFWPSKEEDQESEHGDQGSGDGDAGGDGDEEMENGTNEEDSRLDNDITEATSEKDAVIAEDEAEFTNTAVPLGLPENGTNVAHFLLIHTPVNDAESARHGAHIPSSSSQAARPRTVAPHSANRNLFRPTSNASASLRFPEAAYRNTAPAATPPSAPFVVNPYQFRTRAEWDFLIERATYDWMYRKNELIAYRMQVTDENEMEFPEYEALVALCIQAGRPLEGR